MRSMLYYPFVQPPRDVLAQGVLYWDQIGSIVPSHYELPEHLKKIADRGLYNALNVERYLSPILMERLARQVDELLRDLSPSEIKLPKDPLTASTRLHYGKLPYELEYRLRSDGGLRDAGSAYQASEALLGPLITLLARAVAEGSDPTVGWVCHTNSSRAAGMAYGSRNSTGAPGWRVKMGWIFKVPPADTPLEEMLDFRRRYEDERVALLRAVDRFVSELGGPDAPELIPQIAEELGYAMKQIEAASRARGLRLRRAVAYGTLAAGAGAGVSAAEAFGPIAEAATAGALGVLGSLLSGATQTRIRPEVISPYNYLHRARTQFGT